MKKPKPKAGGFDIDAAMAEEGIGGDFDIDAAMAEEGIAPIKQTMVPGAREASDRQLAEGDGEPVTMSTDAAPKTSIWKKLAGRISNVPASASPGVGVPISKDQALARYRGLSNAATFGMANHIRAGVQDDDAHAMWDKASEENPIDEMGGALIGSLASGKIVDAGARGIVGAVAPKALARSTIGRIGQSAATGALSGGAQSATMGQDMEEGASVGAALSGGVALAGEAGRGVARALRGNNWIGKFAKAKDSGRMALVEAEAARGEISTDSPGQLAAASKATERINAREAEIAAAASAKHQAARAPHLPKTADLDATAESLNRLVDGNRSSTGEIRDVKLAREIERISKKLNARSTNDDLLYEREALKEAAGFDQVTAPTEAQLRARKIYFALRDGTKSGPIGEADAAFHQTKLGQEARADLLTGSLDGTPEIRLPGGETGLRAGPEERMIERLGRLGDDNVPGARANRRIDKVREMGDKEINDALEELEARKAWMATRGGLPSMPVGDMPTGLAKAAAWGARAIGQNANALGARAILPAAEAAARGAGDVSYRAGSTVPFLVREKEGSGSKVPFFLRKKK